MYIYKLIDKKARAVQHKLELFCNKYQGSGCKHDFFFKCLNDYRCETNIYFMTSTFYAVTQRLILTEQNSSNK